MTGFGTIIAPSPRSDWVRLAKTKQGTLFRKHILTLGALRHPMTGKKIDVNRAFFDTMKANFDAGVCDIVQVPLANDRNEHVESPVSNIGEVVDLELNGKKIYAVIDARDEDAAKKLGKTYLGASAYLHLNYERTSDGKKVGPTLLHVAVTNRPYVTGLDPYEEIIAASAEYSDEPPALMETEEATVPRKLEEVLQELKDEHEIDVPALQTQLSDVQAELEKRPPEGGGSGSEDGTAELAAAIAEAMKGTEGATKLTGGDVSQDDIISAVAELAQRNVSLSSSYDAASERITALETKNAEAEIDGYVKAGRILPKQRDKMLELSMKDRDTFDALLPDKPLVSMSESGVTPLAEDHEIDVDAEVARLTAPDGAAGRYTNRR